MANRYKDKEKRRLYEKEYHLKTTYGITLDEYNEMLTAQNGVCAICEEEQQGSRPLFVDHCHASTRVRGLLCHSCNLGLGAFRDRPELLDAAKEYLGGERP